MMITGSSSLNGKLTVEINKVEDSTVYVYLQPNNFKNDLNTIGLIENNKVYTHNSKTKFGRQYIVPSDWTVFLVYNVGYSSGGLLI